MEPRARLCWKNLVTSRIGKEDWRPAKEAEKYLSRRQSLESSPYSKSENWIEYEVQR